MEIGHRQKLGFTCFEPFLFSHGLALRAMAVTARIVRRAQMTTAVAQFHVAAKRGRATLLNMAQDSAVFSRKGEILAKFPAKTS